MALQFLKICAGGLQRRFILTTQISLHNRFNAVQEGDARNDDR